MYAYALSQAVGLHYTQEYAQEESLHENLLMPCYVER